MDNKKIFKYNDGFNDVYGDPFDIDYRFQESSKMENMELIEKWISEVPKDQNGQIDILGDVGPLRLFNEACRKLIPFIRAAFNLKPFDPSTGEGLTSEQVFELQAEYNDWKEGLKKNTE